MKEKFELVILEGEENLNFEVVLLIMVGIKLKIKFNKFFFFLIIIFFYGKI